MAEHWIGRTARALAAFGLVMLVGCSGAEEVELTEPEAIAFAEDTLGALTEEEAWWAGFEARHSCATQRTTYETVDGPELALDAALTEASRTRPEYDDFAIRLQTEQRLRDAVRLIYQQTCMG